MPNGDNLSVPPSLSSPLEPPQLAPPNLNKTKLTIIVASAAAIIIIVVLLIRAIVLPSKVAPPPAVGTAGPATPAGSSPSATPPVSVTSGITAWNGTLTLTKGDAKLLVGNRSYDLFIKAAGQSSRILKEMGYNSGEKINVLGKLIGNYLEVAGVSK